MKLKGPLEASKSTQNPEFQNILTKNDDFRAKKSQRELKLPAPFVQGQILIYVQKLCES